MKLTRATLLAVAVVAGSTFVLAANADDKGSDHGGNSKAAMTTAGGDMVEGEVRKVDKEAKKITLKHGDIKNLDMPGMTMVFQVKDAALLDKVHAGDKVRFRAEKAGSGIMVTDIQTTK
jgi:Cu(I)/Ag(I) efflux system protein CusF